MSPTHKPVIFDNATVNHELTCRAVAMAKYTNSAPFWISLAMNTGHFFLFSLKAD